jgi:predicted transcriptional regulator
MSETPEDKADRNARIVARRDAGGTWLEIQREFGLTRQQARYAYQLGKRAERRSSRRQQN